MTLLDDFRKAKDIEEKTEWRPHKVPKDRKRGRCPFVDEKMICKISQDFVERGLRNKLFVCICSEFYVNCDIYKKYWHSGGENEIE